MTPADEPRKPASTGPPTAPAPDDVTAPLPDASEARPSIPRKLGPYELLDRLGQGGMGIVFRARHEKLGTPCAVKVLIAGEHASPAELARFQREASAVAKMGKHPHIVGVYDLDTQGSLTYYAMELVEGVPLSQRLREDPPSPQDAARLVEKVALALQFAHERGIVHRDLKPANVVVRTDGEPQVMDFGLARDVRSTERLSVHGDVMGSPNYMAPEQARGEVDATDARTDVYGLGGILYEMLVGLPPHPGRALAEVLQHVMQGEVMPPRAVRPDVPRDLETIGMKCLQPEQARRYETARALAEDLGRFLRGEPVLARPVGWIGRAARRVRRHPLASAIVAGTSAVLLALAWGAGLLAPAYLSIETDPADARVEAIGATVWGGRWIWPAKTCILRISAPGREPEERPIVPHPLRACTLAGIVRLRDDHGRIEAASEPPGATLVWQGGLEEGSAVTPAALSLRNGTYRVFLRLADHLEFATVVTIQPETPVLLGTVTLAHERGTLSVTTDPPGVTVILREPTSRKEVTRLSPPLTVEVPTGAYLLDAQLSGHFPRSRAVTVRPGATAHLTLNPQATWSRTVGGGFLGSPALGELDGDGILDTVVASEDHRVYALSGADGAVLWLFETGGEAAIARRLADLDRDGVLDCVATSEDGIVRALSGRSGVLLWKTTIRDAFAPALADLNGDGVADCVVNSGNPSVIGSGDRHVYALSGRDGAVLWSYETGKAPSGAPSLADLDGDGSADCVVVAGKVVQALSGKSGALLWTYESAQESYASASFADFDRDGVLDCAMGLEYGLVVVLSGRDGRPLREFKIGDWAGSTPAMADVDGDGVLDCVVASQDNKLQVLSGLSGASLWTFEWGGRGTSDPVIVDIDGDGRLDCVAGDGDTRVYALSGKDGRALWVFEADVAVFSTPALADVDGDGVLDCVVTTSGGDACLLRATDAGDLWRFYAGWWITGAPALADLDGDGVPDCVVGARDKGIYALSGRDGQVLWRCDDYAPRAAALGGDLDGDGVPDPVFGVWSKGLVAVSGRSGARLWPSPFDPASNSSTPAQADLNGDGVVDCVVAAWESGRGGDEGRGVHAVSGRDGRVLWSRMTGDIVEGSAALADLNADGVADCVVVSSTSSASVHALSGRGGMVIWSASPGGSVATPALADIDGDGVVDVVVGCTDGRVVTLSGRTGIELWGRDGGARVHVVTALADLDGDGVHDFVVGREDGWVQAISGKKGEALWGFRTGGEVVSSAASADLDADGVADCVFGSKDHRVYALSGRDGALLWSRETGDEVNYSPALADLDGDGRPECVVGSDDGWVRAIGGRALARPAPAVRWRDATSTATLSRARRAEAWTTLAELAEECVGSTPDPWVRGVAWFDLGLCRARMGDFAGALAAFAQARDLRVEPPEGALEEWAAAWGDASCGPARREEAATALLGAILRRPDEVLEAAVEGRSRNAAFAAAFREVAEEAARRSPSPVVPALLLAMPLADGTRPYLPRDGARDLLVAARTEVLRRMGGSEVPLARSQGYLALIADALEEKEACGRACGQYFELAWRRPAIDLMVREASQRK